ncbi:MAG: DUF4349 domain-containing protein, partial [Chloroflexota bacterium]
GGLIGLLLIFLLFGSAFCRRYEGLSSFSPTYDEYGYNEGAAGFTGADYDSADDSFYEAEESVAAIADGELARSQVSGSLAPQNITRLIIKEGYISMEVENTLKTHAQIEDLVASLASEGAYVISSNENGNTGGKSPIISMQIRIPAEQFDTSMDRIAAMGVEIRDRNENSDDVSEEFVDLQNRIESLESARQRLLEIMENADTTEDLLKAEAQLTFRETELESLKGRLNFLSDSARLSRISINLQPYNPAQPLDTSWSPSKAVREAIESLIESAEDFADFLIFFSIAVLPWLIFFWLIISGVRRWNNSRKAKKEAKE